MRILYFGTPEVSVPFLEFVYRKEEIVGVVTQADKPEGRGQKLHQVAVKKAALALHLKVYQPHKVKDEQFIELVRKIKPDLIIVVAYGQILPLKLLEIPLLGALNLHFSLLPKYRGPAPVQWAIIKGEKKTGVTSIFMNETVDAGGIILQKEIEIAPEDNSETLQNKLIPLGIEVLSQTLELIKDVARKEEKKERLIGLISTCQDGQKGDFAPLIEKKNGEINWDNSAQQINNLIRGLRSWPQVFTFIKKRKPQMPKEEYQDQKKVKIKILETKVISDIDEESSISSGQIVSFRKGEGFIVKCREKCLLVTLVQPENSKVISAHNLWQGYHLKIGDQLG